MRGSNVIRIPPGIGVDIMVNERISIEGGGKYGGSHHEQPWIKQMKVRFDKHRALELGKYVIRPRHYRAK